MLGRSPVGRCREAENEMEHGRLQNRIGRKLMASG